MLVFEFVESDLKKFMKKGGGALDRRLVQNLSFQLLSGRTRRTPRYVLQL